LALNFEAWFVNRLVVMHHESDIREAATVCAQIKLANFWSCSCTLASWCFMSSGDPTRALVKKKRPVNTPAVGLPASGPGWGGPAKGAGNGLPFNQAPPAGPGNQLAKGYHDMSESERVKQLKQSLFDIATTSTFEANKIRAAEAYLSRTVEGAVVQRNLNHEMNDLEALDDNGLARRAAELEARMAKGQGAPVAPAVPEVPGGVVH
jgi:hypothetical protein